MSVSQLPDEPFVEEPDREIKDNASAAEILERKRIKNRDYQRGYRARQKALKEAHMRDDISVSSSVSSRGEKIAQSKCNSLSRYARQVSREVFGEVPTVLAQNADGFYAMRMTAQGPMLVGLYRNPTGQLRQYRSKL